MGQDSYMYLNYRTRRGQTNYTHVSIQQTIETYNKQYTINTSNIHSTSNTPIQPTADKNWRDETNLLDAAFECTAAGFSVAHKTALYAIEIWAPWLTHRLMAHNGAEHRGALSSLSSGYILRATARRPRVRLTPRQLVAHAGGAARE